ncbi:MAG: hypothetical protein HC880_21070, partial [Bacteroidia bacterium]|nr:hypothetical protein [Bacteroidia bacterium]
MPLREVLSQKVRLNQLDTSRVTLLFECRDRYVVSMPLGQALSRPAFIVDQDLDTPPGKQWVPIYKGDE